MKFEILKLLRSKLRKRAAPAQSEAVVFDTRLLRGSGAGDVLLLMTDQFLSVGQRERLHLGAVSTIESAASGLKVVVLDGGWRAQTVSAHADPESQVTKVIIDDLRRSGPIWQQLRQSAPLSRRWR